jgi:hypothetical protein
MDKKNKINKNDSSKIESMKQVIHKVISKESAPKWSKHVPVYGWIKMNYPSKLQPSMIEKYRKDQEKLQKEAVELVFPPISYTYDETYYPGNKYRLDPHKICEDVMKDSKFFNFS